MHEAFMQFIVNVTTITLSFIAFILAILALIDADRAKDRADTAQRRLERLEDEMEEAKKRGRENFLELRRDITSVDDELTDAAVELGLVYTEGESAGWKKPKGKR